MEQIKRKIINYEREVNNKKFHMSLIDGTRLSIRWKIKDDEYETIKEDIVINFTREETNKIKEILR